MREGIACEGSGEVSVREMARERRLGRSLGPRFGLLVFSLGMVFMLEEQARGGKRLIKLMIYGVPCLLHSPPSIHFCSIFFFYFFISLPRVTILFQPHVTVVLLNHEMSKSFVKGRSCKLSIKRVKGVSVRQHIIIIITPKFHISFFL